MKAKKKSKKGNSQIKQNVFHKEYGLISNLAFVLAQLIKYDLFSMFLVILGAVIAPFHRYLWTFISKFIIDIILENGKVNRLLTVMFAFVFSQLAITMLKTLADNKLPWRFTAVRYKVVMLLNRKAMMIDFEHLENPDVMDCYERAKFAISNNGRGFEGMLNKMKLFLEALSISMVGLVIMGIFSPLLVLLMIGLSIIQFVVTNRTTKATKKEVWDPLASWWRKHDYMDHVSTDFAFAKDIRMFGLRGWLLRKYRDLNLIRYGYQKKDAILWSKCSITFTFLSALCKGSTYTWLVYSVLYRNLSIGNFAMYLASAETFFQYVYSLLDQLSDLIAKSREVDDFRSFLDFEGNAPESGKAEVPKSSHYEFIFDHVSFRYPGSKRYALKNFNLTLHAGERLAVVGQNGAGKSTMIKLLLRLYEPTEGKILLNNVDVRKYRKESYYKIFAPVFQNVELFAFPISQNISMQDSEDTNSKKAESCMVQAGLGAKLSSLPEGVDTQLLKIIYDNGIDLSGGEKQKLALSRALYKDSPVVLLDEPTAALDAIAEAKLYEDFEQLIGGKTAIYISHRLSSTQFCSAIAIFNDGMMIEYGSHTELMKKNGAYANLFNVQAQYYVEDKESEEMIIHEV